MRGTFQDRLHQRGVEAMSAAVGDETSGQIAAGQGEVADHVEYFMTDALVWESQRVAYRAVRVEHQEVVERGPLPQTLGLQRGGFALQHERAAGGQAHVEIAGRKRHFQ